MDIQSPSVSTGTRMMRPVPRAKFFFVGDEKFHLQGVTYGPFRPEPGMDIFFKSPDATRRDFQMISECGFNVLRTYHVPPNWFMDLAEEHGLRVITTVPWEKRVLFLDDIETRRKIQSDMRNAAHAHAGHPAVLGFFLDNEIPPDLVRWYGPRRVEDFLDSLVHIVKSEDSSALCAYANFPPTEYLLPTEVDFYSYNVYLHDPKVLQAYLRRLQNVAEDKPLILGEFGMDTIRHTEHEQADLLEACHGIVFRAGLAGVLFFSWTDEWYTNGIDVEDWAFGMVKKDRTPKESYRRLQKCFIRPGVSLAKAVPLKVWPKVSVVVCSYNGAPTLRACLESLQGLDYPDYEVIVVDDGSKDNTQDILVDFPGVNNIRQKNMGLSVARNVGINASKGDIVAFTDSDCMVDKDWLYYLVQPLIDGDFAAVGGPNISPPAVSFVQAAVAAAPGGPSHVLLSDLEAEHVPGCNIAFHRWALDLIGGFDPEYRKAGDDVDVCWRLMQAGYRIGFSPSALVWHHRRFTVKAFFNQQRGYGEAEALLRCKHLQFFDEWGSARWRGTIYGQPKLLQLFRRPLIYHGVFGTGFFQSVYRRPYSEWVALVSSLEWVGTALFILLVSPWIELLKIVPLIMIALTIAPAWSYMVQAKMEPKFERFRSRLLLFYLALAQPLVREWARHFTWLRERHVPLAHGVSDHEMQEDRSSSVELPLLAFWSEAGLERNHLLEQLTRIVEEQEWVYTLDTGWNDWDLMVFANRFWHVKIKTLTEIYPHGRRMTRAETKLQADKFSLLVLFAVLVVAAFMMRALPMATSSLLPGDVYLWLILGLVAAAVLVWFWNGISLRGRVARLVLQAGVRAGMLPVKNK